MGTGPYVLVSREPDGKTVLERKPNWWGKPEGNVDHAEFNILANAATPGAAVLSGGMEMIYSVPPQELDRIAASRGVKIIDGPDLRMICLAMDQNRDELLFSSIKG